MESYHITDHVCCHIFRFELQLQPTGEVEQYSASASYALQNEDGASVDTLKVVAQAEGKCPASIHRSPMSQVQDSRGERP